MKTQLISFVAIFTLLLGCNPKSDDTPTADNPLQGKWFMQSFSAFAPSYPNLSEEYDLWIFDLEENKLNVVDYFLGVNLILPSGEYDITYTDTEISIIITSDYIETFSYSIEDELLILDAGEEYDGVHMTFVPKNTECADNPFNEYEWLNEIKTNFEMLEPAAGTQIIQYIYDEECVYLVDNCVDCDCGMIRIYNTSGDVICEIGGVGGLETCVDFFETASNKRYLYNDITFLEE